MRDNGQDGARRAAEPPAALDAGPPTQPSLEAHPDPIPPLLDNHEPSPPCAVAVMEETEQPEAEQAQTSSEEAGEAEQAPSEPHPAPAHPVVVPGQYHYLKRWILVLVVAAVWIPAAAIGLGLYYYWYHSFDKTWPVFLVLMFVVVCTLAGLLLAMVEHKPVLTALAVALMSAPFAATVAAAVLHGTYFCERVGHCLLGVIPY